MLRFGNLLFFLVLAVAPALLRRIHWKPGRTLPSAQVVITEVALITRAAIVLGLVIADVVGLGVAIELILLGPSWLGFALTPLVAGFLLITGVQIRLVVLGWRAREIRQRAKRTVGAVGGSPGDTGTTNRLP